MRVAALAIAVTVAGCGGSSPSSGFEGAGQPGGGGFGGEGSSGGFGSKSPADAGGTQAGCSEEAKLVYVVDAEDGLYSFEPSTLTFTRIGTLSCAAGAATPNSMAVDRSGTAWVNYSDGRLFKVSTKDASCQATSFQPGQQGFTRFGMAFASNSAGSEDETLFVCGIDGASGGKGLAKIDLGSLTLTRIGDFSGALEGMAAELTGTGEGKLFGFFTTFPNATLAEIAKSNAATSGDKDLAGVSTGNAWAFSFWGGDFWFYTSSGLTPSRVTRLRTSTGAVEVVKPDVGGFRIVGAGVSTCAPTTSPR